MLLDRSKQDNVTAAERIAAQVGAMPLALEQVASFIEVAQVSLAKYAQLLESHKTDLLSQRSPFTDYTGSAYSVFDLNRQAARASNRASDDLLISISFIAPQLIPRWLLPALMNSELSEVEQLGLLADLSSRSLISLDLTHIEIHPLHQAFIRESLSTNERHRRATDLALRLSRCFPDDESSAYWPVSQQLVDHVGSLVDHLDIAHCEVEDIEILLNNTGTYLAVRGRVIEALPLAEGALNIAQRIYGPGNSKLARVMISMAVVLDDLGRRESARGYLNRAVDILESAASPDLQDRYLLGVAYSNWGSSLLEDSLTDDAEKMFKRAKQIHEAVYGTTHYSTAIDINNLGRVKREQQDWQAAFELFDQSVKLMRHAISKTDFRLDVSLHCRASALFNLKREGAAIRDLREALDILDSLFPEPINRFS